MTKKKPKLTAKDKLTMKQIAAGMSKRRKKKPHKITVVTGDPDGGAGGSHNATVPSGVSSEIQGGRGVMGVIPVEEPPRRYGPPGGCGVSMESGTRAGSPGGCGVSMERGPRAGGGGGELIYALKYDKPEVAESFQERRIIVIWPYTLIAGLLIGFVCGSFAGMSWQADQGVMPPPAKHRCSDYAGWYWSSEQGKCVRDEP